jgi:hypothetical protein
MTPFLVFNELSAFPLAQDTAAAKGYLDCLSEALLDRRIPVGSVFVGPNHFLQTPICAGYSIGRWLSEYRDRDNRLRLRLLLEDRRRDYDDCIAADGADSEVVEYKFEGTAAAGLSTALLTDGLSLSVTRVPWDVTKILIEKSWIDDDAVRTCGLSVPHASRAKHLDDHADWLWRFKTPAPASGVHLWQQKGKLFQSLDFCACTEVQVVGLGGDGPLLRAVMRGLRDLNKYCEGWTSGGFNIKAISSASGESGATLDKYGDQRKFTCPDGKYRTFSWHKKLSDGFRIYFFDFPAERRLLIGYVGKHLDSVNYD